MRTNFVLIFRFDCFFTSQKKNVFSEIMFSMSSKKILRNENACSLAKVASGCNLRTAERIFTIELQGSFFNHDNVYT